MSNDGSSPEYDFSLEKAGQLPHFDPEQIAEQAVWPAVNHLWRSNWRQDSYPGDDFMFPGRGVGFHERDVIYVTMSANCYGLGPIASEEDGEVELRHAATVQVEKVAAGGLREVILGRVDKVRPELLENFAEPDSLIAKLGVAYAFDTDEPAEVNAFQAIETPSGTVLWVSEKFDEGEIESMGDELEPDTNGEYYYDGEGIIFDEDKFHEHDVDNLITALSILDAPEQCLRSLRIIKGQPLGAEAEANE